MTSIKGFLAAGVALVVCPCHLPVTLPLFLALTGGSAIGIWLAQNQWLIWLASFGLFVSWLALAFTWLGRTSADAACEVPPQRRKSSQSLVTTKSSSETR